MDSNPISRCDLPFIRDLDQLLQLNRFRHSGIEILDWFLSEMLTREYGLTHLKLTPVPEEYRKEIRMLSNSYLKTIMLCETSTDLLGMAQQHVESVGHRQMKGAFYTPPEVSYMMAKMQFHDLDWNAYPVLTVADPTAGSGSMLLSVIRVMAEDHTDKMDRLSITAFDKDRRACLCAAVQLLSVCLVNGYQVGELKVIWMDSLTQDVYGYILHCRNRKYGPPTYDARTIADLPHLTAA
jgi:hypothetical protein